MISHLLAYHMSYTASLLIIGAILIPIYCWIKFATTRKGRR